MKKFFLVLLITASNYTQTKAQTNCDDANYYMVSAYSHVKTSYDSYNKSDLQYYANRSFESLKLSKKSLANCNCNNVIELINKGLDLFKKVESAATYEDGRFYVKRARELCKEGVIEIDKCSIGTETISENNDLTDLQNEQLKLQEQQEALKLKEKEIKLKLAEQKEKQLNLEKNVLINSFKKNITTHINTYNSALKTCGCDNKPIEIIDEFEEANFNSIVEVKAHFTSYLKALTSMYLSNLEQCNP